jgi:hypothetical protein
MIRFVNGKPTQVWFSEHSNGEAFTWDAVEKTNDRVRQHRQSSAQPNLTRC